MHTIIQTFKQLSISLSISIMCLYEMQMCCSCRHRPSDKFKFLEDFLLLILIFILYDDFL